MCLPACSNDSEVIELFAALHNVASQCMLHINAAKEKQLQETLMYPTIPRKHEGESLWLQPPANPKGAKAVYRRMVTFQSVQDIKSNI